MSKYTKENPLLAEDQKVTSVKHMLTYKVLKPGETNGSYMSWKRLETDKASQAERRLLKAEYISYLASFQKVTAKGTALGNCSFQMCVHAEFSHSLGPRL